MNLSRQEKLIDGDGMANLKFAIIGGGGIGSNVAYMLTKMGASPGSIHIFDFDSVAEENIAPARFSMKDVEKLKVEAIKEGILEELGVDTVVPHPFHYTDNETGVFDVVISCPDKMDVRREVWNNGEFEWKWLIDGRMGADQAEIYVVGPGRLGQGRDLYDEVIEYDDTELLCGEKATAPVSAGIIPGMIGGVVASIANGEQPPEHLFYAMHTHYMGVKGPNGS